MEFLIENPFLLIIMIGIISSVYKNYKAAGKEGAPRKVPKPFFPGVELGEPVSVPPQVEVKKERSQVVRAPEQVSVGRLHQPRVQGTSPKVAEVTNDTLQDAVVWAEILGPPRAKRSLFKSR